MNPIRRFFAMHFLCCSPRGMDDDLWAARQEMQARASARANAKKTAAEWKARRPEAIHLAAASPRSEQPAGLAISPPMPASPEAYPRPLERYLPAEQRPQSPPVAHSPRLPSPLRQERSSDYPFPRPASPVPPEDSTEDLWVQKRTGSPEAPPPHGRRTSSLERARPASPPVSPRGRVARERAAQRPISQIIMEESAR